MKMRLLQKDVLLERTDWRSMLINALQMYPSPTVVYLSERYNSHHRVIMELCDVLL
jgi:hypothetical protein